MGHDNSRAGSTPSATLAGTQFLGASATFDAMALFLLALATWLGVRSADCQFRARTVLLIATGIPGGVRYAVKYATALLLLVALVVVALAVWRQHGGGAGLLPFYPYFAHGSRWSSQLSRLVVGNNCGHHD